jgi:uncharacterized membrane protein YheB (UPF0754 family)
MNLITTLSPPLVGAFIGWITNYIAIRMLFRPLKPWRLFGVRLPMTPGVIPAKRHEFAVNIGRMVGSQLLTSDDIAKALTEVAFKRELETMINSRVEALLHQDLGPLPAIIPKRFATSFLAGVNVLRWRTLKIIHGYLDSPEFGAGLGATIATHIETFLARPLESWLPVEHQEHLVTSLNEAGAKLLASEQAEAWLRETIASRLTAVIAEGKSLQDLLPPEFTAILIDLLDHETPGLLAKAAQYAAEPAMRERLAKTMGQAIPAFVGSMGPMAALVTGFLSPQLIETKVSEYLADKGDDIALWLNNDQTQARARELLAEKTAAFMARPLREMLALLPPGTLAELHEGITRQALAIVRNPQTGAALATILRQALGTQAGRTGQAILHDLFGPGGVKKGQAWTAAEIMTIIRSAKSKRVLDDLFSSLVDRHILGQPLGPLARLLPKEVQVGFCDYLVQQSHALLMEEVPRLVDFVNIQRIVTRKVDSLDLLRLERLLLSIMEEQFTYINLFGGLLGFIIGLFNLIFQP